MKYKFLFSSALTLALVAFVGSPRAQAASGADLSVSIKTPVASILKGEIVTYAITVLNNGPVAAPSFTLKNEVPAGLTFVSATSGCNLVGTTVTCVSTKINAGSSRAFNVKYSTASASCEASVTNVATVSSLNDPNLANNTSNTVSTTVACPDFSITKSAPLSIAKGNLLLYTIKVTNNGPSVAQTFTMTDLIPEGLVFDSASKECSVAGTSVTCSTRVGAGKSRSISLKFSTDSLACESVINNTASVSAVYDPNASNDTSNTVSTTVTCPDLFITKSAPVTVLKGNLLSYALRVKNNSALATRSFTMKDAVPAGVTFDAASAPVGCSLVGSAVTCSGKVGPGGSRDFTLKFSTTDATCGSVISNTASVSAVNDPNAANDTSNTVTTTVTCQEADLSITKSGPTTIEKGAVLTYSITVANAGPTVTNTVARDVIPSGLTFLPAPQSSKYCKVVGPSVVCNAGNLATGKSATFTLAFGTSAAVCDSTIQNVATVTTNGAIDPNTANNTSATVSTNVTCTSAIENELTIVQKAMATTDTAVKNQKDINLLRFEAHADNEVIVATSFRFNAAQGSLNNAQNYKLWADTDNNGSVDTVFHAAVSPVSGLVTFDNIFGGGVVVPAMGSVIFEVHADVASSLVDNTLQLKFATTLPAYVGSETLNEGTALSGIKTDGVCATTCETTVATAQATIYTLISQGNLYITQPSIPLRSHQLLGGTLGEEILRLQFRAEYEPVDVTLLRFYTVDHGVISVDRLELFYEGQTTPFAFATGSVCGTGFSPGTFCVALQNHQLVVPKGSILPVLVRAHVKTDVDGAISGELVQIGIAGGMFEASVEARGVLSTNELNRDGETTIPGKIYIGGNQYGYDDTVAGGMNFVTLSKVTSIKNASPDADGTAIPTGSQRAIGQFKFSAAAANNTKNGMNRWTLSDIIFNVNATNVLLGSGDQTALATSDFKIYSKLDPTMKSTCTADKAIATDALVITCSNLMSSSVNTEIEPGSDVTFVLEAEVVNAKISNTSASTLQVSLQNFSDISASAFSPSQSHIRWLDQDFGSSTQFFGTESSETVINSTSFQG